MNLRRSCGLGLATLFLLVPRAHAQQPQFDLQNRVVATEKEAVLMLPPELIAAPVVTDLSISPSGRYLILKRQEIRITSSMLKEPRSGQRTPPGEESLILWDSRSRAASVVWRQPMEDAQVGQVAWFPRTDVALAVVRQTAPADPLQPDRPRQTRSVVLRIAGGSERADVITVTDPAVPSFVDLRPSPVLSQIMMTQTLLSPRDGQQASMLALLDPSGHVKSRAALPPAAMIGSTEWGDDGSPLILLVETDPEKKSVMNRWFSMDPATGGLRPMKDPPRAVNGKLTGGGLFQAKPAAEETSLNLRVKLATSAAREGDTSQRIGLLWLESVKASKQPRALVSSDCSSGSLLRGGETVVYQSQGAAWAAPLLKMDLGQFLAMRQAAERMVLMNHGKQFGLAVINYAQENEDFLPGGDNLPADLSPYADDPSIFTGLKYTIATPTLGEIAEPSKTELGFIEGAGGRAVIFADGHVVWRSP
jgi:hypothetical protein